MAPEVIVTIVVFAVMICIGIFIKWSWRKTW